MMPSHGPLFTKPRRRALRLWAGFAFLNLGVGLLISLQPERLNDIANVVGWTGDWLLRGQDVYANPELILVYPPHAVVLLAPLAMLPFNVAVGFWVIASIVFVFLSAYFAAKFFQPHAAFRSILLPILMFASWWGAHTLVEFSLAALVLSMAAMMLAERRPVMSGVYLGLALMKPQMALPVLLWMLFTSRWKSIAAAAAIVATGTAIYCARVAANPISVVQHLFANLRIYYTGDAIMTGATDLRPLIHLFVQNVSTLDMVAGGVSLALFAGICAAGFQEGRWRTRTLYSAPPLMACWSLLAFYHLSYGFVILLPALMLLVFNDAPQTALRRRLVWALQIGMMVNVPGLLRHSGLGDQAMAAALIQHFDRFLTLGIFAGLVTLAWHE
jgi:glycosyl transferase family 87